MPEQNPNALAWPDVQAIRGRLARLAATPLDALDWSKIREQAARYPEGRDRSRAAAAEAGTLITGGSQHSLALNSPFPPQFERAAGPYLWDVDGNRYIDFVQGGGSNLLGAAPRAVADRVKQAIDDYGSALALCHPGELELARLVRRHVPSVERFRMLASGTEAVAAAIRAARAFTGAPHVVKVSGAYHGWSEPVLVGLTPPAPGNRRLAGVPRGALDYTHEVPPNDLAALETVLEATRADGGTAAVVVEPLGPQSGTLPVDRDHHAAVARLCREHGALLIFDEVVTGFRLGLGGVQGYLDLRPDLTAFGKCLTAGYPGSGAVGGRADVLSVLAPGSPSFTLVAGTLSASPLTVAAGRAALEEMERVDAPGLAARYGALLAAGLTRLVDEHRLPFVAYHYGSIVHLQTSGFFHLPADLPDYREQALGRRGLISAFCAAAAVEGLNVPATGRLFVSTTHDLDVLDDVLDRFDRLFGLITGH